MTPAQKLPAISMSETRVEQLQTFRDSVNCDHKRTLVNSNIARITHSCCEVQLAFYINAANGPVPGVDLFNEFVRVLSKYTIVEVGSSKDTLSLSRDKRTMRGA